MSKSLLITILLVFNIGCAVLPKEPARIYDPSLYVNEYTDINESLVVESTAKPYFPMAAFKANQQGWCVAQYDVNSLGKAENIQIIDCSPKAYFEEACRIIVTGLKYSNVGLPAQKVTRLCSFRLKPN